jgi:enamine deaminase RidA (YjgF/YER057c/UK114 family)
MTTTLLTTLVLIGAPILAGHAQQPPRQHVEHLDAGSEAEWGYAQAIEAAGTIYLSGTIGSGATLEAQMSSAYDRIRETLARYGATMQDIVKETVYTTDMQALAAANAVRKQAYGGHAPAATWVQITKLLSPRALLEIEVTAVTGSGAARAP